MDDKLLILNVRTILDPGEEEVRRNTDPCPATDGRQRQQGTFIYLLFTFLRAFHRLSPATAARAVDRVLVSADNIYSRPGEYSTVQYSTVQHSTVLVSANNIYS